MMQLTLIRDDKKHKELRELSLDVLSISEYNPRRTRLDEDVMRLAERIDRNGFEITRALWVYPSGEGYHVFAGGSRMKAASLAGLHTVPCVVYDGFSDAEIAQLAYEDNENDEYHAPLSMFDDWDYCLALYKKHKSYTRVSEFVPYGDSFVRYKIKLAELPTWFRAICTKQDWSEGICREFLQSAQSADLEGYDGFYSADELLQRATIQAAKKNRLTAKQARECVDDVNTFVEHVKEVVGV